MATFLLFGTIWLPLICVSLLIATVYYALYYMLYLRQTKRWKESNIPFLQPTFLLGHEYFKDKYCATVPIDKIYKENHDKELVGFFMGTLPVILIRNPKLVNQVIVKNFNKAFGTGFEMAEFEVEAHYMISTTSDKTKWKLGHAIMSPFFSSAILAGSRFDIVKEEINKLLYNATRAEVDGCPLNIMKLSRDFMTNAITLPNFGVHSDSKEKARALSKIPQQFFEPSVYRLLGMFLRNQLPAFFQVFEPLKLLSSYMRNTMANIMKEHIGSKEQHYTEKYDFIDYLRGLKDTVVQNDSCEVDQPQNYEGLNFRHKVGLSLLLAISASESVITLIQFSIHMLSLHPEYQLKIREEVDEAMKKHRTSEFKFNVVKDLHFTQQCLYETARLYPIMPMIIRQCSEDFQIPGTEYILRKGDRVIAAPYSMHYDAKYFRNPLQFDPYRFSSKTGEDVFSEAYWSFGGGPRKCPGIKQGLITAAAFVASLLQKYEIKPHSHMEQIDATDFHPLGFVNLSSRDILIDIVRCDKSVGFR